MAIFVLFEKFHQTAWFQFPQKGIAQLIAFLLPAQPARVRITAPQFFSDSDVAVLINCVHCLDGGQYKSLIIVDRTHPVLARAVLQKKPLTFPFRLTDVGHLLVGHFLLTVRHPDLAWKALTYNRAFHSKFCAVSSFSLI